MIIKDVLITKKVMGKRDLMVRDVTITAGTIKEIITGIAEIITEMMVQDVLLSSHQKVREVIKASRVAVTTIKADLEETEQITETTALYLKVQ